MKKYSTRVYCPTCHSEKGVLQMTYLNEEDGALYCDVHGYVQESRGGVGTFLEVAPQKSEEIAVEVPTESIHVDEQEQEIEVDKEEEELHEPSQESWTRSRIPWWNGEHAED